MKAFWAVVVVILLSAGSMPAQAASAASTNNFHISNYDIQYELSRDSEGRSALKTTETITAEFRRANQNRGIERALPTKYDGHSTGLKIESVTDGTGTTLQYSENNNSGLMVLRIGDPNKYVMGTQTYKITYTQRDVTKSFTDTQRDEWYWDTNGTEWKVPIYRLNVAVTIDTALLKDREGEPACYQGRSGSTTKCEITASGDGRYEVSVRSLSAGQNVSVAFGFKQETFTPYVMSTVDRIFQIWLLSLVVTSALALGVFIYLSVQYNRRNNRTNELKIIPVEYIPPKNTSVMISSQFVQPWGSAFTAQLIDLAVRHVVAIVETKEKTTWQAAEYDIKILSDPNLLLAEEKEILSDMFGALPKAGDRLALKSLRNNISYTKRTLDNDKKLSDLITGEYALRTKDPVQSKYFRKAATVMLIAGILTISPLLVLFAGIVALYGYVLRPLTDKGLALKRYLMGLDRYIKAAEVERIKFLQGPDTAQKVGESVDPSNPGQLVKLYERVLPYAILFGREKEWSKRLGDLYNTTQTSPDWYTGQTAFNAALFAGIVSNFSHSGSYSAGASSSSGGSSGGGYSGGGGGGGGGGGW